MLLEVRALWVGRNKSSQSTFSKWRKKKSQLLSSLFWVSVMEIQANIAGAAAELLPLWTTGGSGTRGLSQPEKSSQGRVLDGWESSAPCAAPWGAGALPCFGPWEHSEEAESSFYTSMAAPGIQLSLPDCSFVPKVSVWPFFTFCEPWWLWTKVFQGGLCKGNKEVSNFPSTALWECSSSNLTSLISPLSVHYLSMDCWHCRGAGFFLWSFQLTWVINLDEGFLTQFWAFSFLSISGAFFPQNTLLFFF